MKSQSSSPPYPTKTLELSDSIQFAWEEIRTHLERLKKDIYQAIQSYPAPIPACDQQFNYLLEERTKIFLEIRRLNQASQEGLVHQSNIQSIQDFIQSSTYLDNEMKKKVNAYIDH